MGNKINNIQIEELADKKYRILVFGKEQKDTQALFMHENDLLDLQSAIHQTRGWET